MGLKKFYIIGPEKRLRELFPGYNRNDERKSTDGRMLIEVELSDMKAAEILDEDDVALCNHEQVLALLDSEPEKWGGSPSESREYTKMDLESKRKAELIEIAEGRGIETAELTKDKIIEEILKA